MNAAEFAVPILICIAVAACIGKKVPIYSEFCSGAEQGMRMLVNILPAMIAVLSAASMLRESGITTFIAQTAAKFLPLEIPEDVLCMAVLRPVSGSGAAGLLAEILNEHGANSMPGRIAAVISASSETTLYVLMVYFGSTRVKYTKRVVAAALVGDFVCVLSAVWTCGIFF